MLESPNNQERPEQIYEDINFIVFQRIEETDPEYTSSIKIFNPNNRLSTEELEQKAREEVKSKKWWLNEYWQSKGDPKEQLSIKSGNLNFELYNFWEPLSPEQESELESILGSFGNSEVGGKLTELNYILIDNNPIQDPKTNEPRRGYSFNQMKTIVLYPRAMSEEPHRIASTSSFAGTLSHEIGHILANSDFVEEWKRRFGWVRLEDGEVKTVGDFTALYKNEQPDRLVSDYAKFTPEEDICESLVAAINNPEVLDPERLAFLREHWLKEKEEEKSTVFLVRKTESEIEVPKVEQPVKYGVRVGRTFKMGKIEN